MLQISQKKYPKNLYVIQKIYLPLRSFIKQLIVLHI